MRLLVLGGGRFVGPAVVEAALSAGWEVTAFNRGRTGRVPRDAEAIVGDRTDPEALRALGEGTWDAAVDTWSRDPRVVRDAAKALAGSVERYAYVSSRSVYRWPPAPEADETAPVVEGDPDSAASDYPSDKRGGELAVERALGSERVVLLRAGLILGPGEDVGRLPWWLRRVSEGGRVLAPGPPDLPLQYVDARDLAAFAILALESTLSGPFDVVSRTGHATMQAVLEACRRSTGSDADLVWVDPDFLLAADVEPWIELPIWVPPGHEDHAVHSSDVTRAHDAGLRCRPVEETVADTWRWMRETPPEDWAPDRSADLGIGLAGEKEHAILARWEESKGRGGSRRAPE